ncbi:MAG: SufS family cysteine desulfurase [Alphaproteobacteria bacterium]|nr:SufS family cysteine desulfurase [Alphaproteobacteria bacterium]
MAEINHKNPWREDFPALSQTMNGKRLAFLDSGASAQKPRQVIEAMKHAIEYHYANIHRGLYEYSQEKTTEYEAVREKLKSFLGASDAYEAVFTKNTTEAVNLVAQSWGRTNLKEGDEIILTEMEHHANFVPWHILKSQIGITIKYIPVLDNGALDLSKLDALLSDKTKLVAFTHVSNVLGTVNPVADIIKQIKAHSKNTITLVDGSQAAVHGKVNIADLGTDFYVLTAHKLYGPTGAGALIGRKTILETMPPWQGGGDMIENVTLDGCTYADIPARFEAGTPAIAEVIGWGAALDYMTQIGMDKIHAWESEILAYLNARIAEIDGVKIYGTTEGKAGIVSFTIDGCPPSDIAMILDQMGVAVRTGHHCCQPLMQRFGIEGTVRASIGLYTDKQDIDQLIEALVKAKKMLS